ncbi:MAG: hypothetical protein ACI4XM_03210 [Candidatus Coprovivens sp.]
MFLFSRARRKEIDSSLEEKKLSITEIYLRNINEHVAYYGKIMNVKNPLDDKSFYEKIASVYYKAAMNIVDFVIDRYPDDIIDSNKNITLDYNALLGQMNDESKKLFIEPSYPEVIYINKEKYPTCIYIQDNKVIKADGIECLPKLSKALANERINKLFEGMTPIEVRDLLLQMGILPKNNDLEKTINHHQTKIKLHRRFLESVICLLIVVDRNRASNKKAKFLANSLGIPFDFDADEYEYNKSKKLVV